MLFMELSERLYNIARLATPGLTVADVGCDHAYVAIYLVQQSISPKIIAMDVRKGPLKRADMHIREAGLEGKIETRLSDGVKELKTGEAECLILAGMGGALMQKIMSEGSEILKEMVEFILQPQSEIAQFRHFLQNDGYHIIAESIVCEDGKYYPMFKAIHGSMNDTEEIDFRYGKILLQDKNPVLYQFLCKEQEYYQRLIKELQQSRRTERIIKREKEVESEYQLVVEALNRYR